VFHVDGDDLRPRRHDLADLQIAETDHALDHLLLVRIDGAFRRPLRHHRENLLVHALGGGLGLVAQRHAASRRTISSNTLSTRISGQVSTCASRRIGQVSASSDSPAYLAQACGMATEISS